MKTRKYAKFDEILLYGAIIEEYYIFIKSPAKQPLKEYREHTNDSIPLR
jgi:hypothetical protein